MSTRQLRSKRKVVSPVPSECQPTSEGPSRKRVKKTCSVDLSESSESSSDEIAHSSKVVKVETSKTAFKKLPSPVPDFSSIEQNIFLGVSKLSDSESDDSDFEEVSTAPVVTSNSETTQDLLAHSSQTFPEKIPSTSEIGDLLINDSISEQSRNKNLYEQKDNNKSEIEVQEVDKKAMSKGKTTRSSKRNLPVGTEVNVKTKSPNKSVNDKERPVRGMEGRRGKRGCVDGGQANVEGCNNIKVKPKNTSESVAVKKEEPQSFEDLDVAQLLALGEGLGIKVKSPEASDSEGGSEEWEEVDTATIQNKIPKSGVEITLSAPEFSWKRKKQRDQEACLQAEMNRAFNRVRRELQLLCHKTSLLLWFAHGMFLNSVINCESVKALALSLIPNDLCSVPKASVRKYVDQLLKWFSKEFDCSEGFPETGDQYQCPPLQEVLEHHFSRRFAKSYKELTFMFVATLRAAGLESRLIISFQPLPLKPQSGELLPINKKAGKSKAGRPSKVETSKNDSKSEADSKEVLNKAKEKDTPKSSKRKPATNRSPKTLKQVTETDPSKENLKGSRSGQRSSKAVLEKENDSVNRKKGAQKSAPASKHSPPKRQGLRRKSAAKNYKEKLDSDEENSDDEKNATPILSPGKKKSLDSTSRERLQDAAAKRVPLSKRSSSVSIKNSKSAITETAGPSTSKKQTQTKVAESDSDFEPVPKKDKRLSHNDTKVSPYFSKSPRSSQSISQHSSSESSEDSDFMVKPKVRGKSVKKTTPTKGLQSKANSSLSKGKGVKVLSSDEESLRKKLTSSGSDYWVEVYLKDEDSWVCIDIQGIKVDSSKGILARATQPVCYVLAFNADGTIKDVTKRYSPKYSQVTAKQRVSVDWWEKTLKPFKPKQTRREVHEDSEMNLVELDRPLPKTIGECKNHPLYAIKRHLLKFEAIYPPDAPTLGFIRDEAIYARQNVYTLHSREIWMKDAKVVRPGQEPYKIVKARPKYDRMSGKVITDLPLEVFGPWQVEDYVPPPAVDGKVPRNAYGNVELFKPTMLPKGCVHLQVPGLSRVAKKLQIDCAPAVVGFDYHSGGCHPTYDGFVVCEENVDVLMDAWNREIDESAKRREEKHEKRVYGNWRRLIRGLLIREQLKHRYDFNGENENDPGSSTSTVNSNLLKASRISEESAPLPCLFPKLLSKMKERKPNRRSSVSKESKTSVKTKAGKQGGGKPARRRRKDDTSEEEEAWDSSTTEEDESEMVLLSDEDSGSEFEDWKNKQ